MPQLDRTAVVRTRMPGGVGGVASRDVPLSRSIHKRNCKVWGSQAPNPCNLKCPRIRETDSRSIAYRLVHGRLITLSKWFVGGGRNEFDPQSSHVGNKNLD